MGIIKKRPLGITILAILNLASGALILIGFLFILFPVPFTAHGSPSGNTGPAMRALVVIVVCSLLAAFQLCIGIGLWKLHNWGRVATIIICGIDLVRSPLVLARNLSRNNSLRFYEEIIGMALCALLIWYLFRPRVKSAFGLKAPQPAE